jgi:hypothetical protein
LNSHGRFEVGTEEVSKECAQGGGMSWRKIREYIEEEGEALLKASVMQTEMLGIR